MSTKVAFLYSNNFPPKLILKTSVSCGLKCYSCGWRRMTMDGEMMEIPDTPFCNDFANPTDNVETCANENDCCASLKEEHIR